MLREFVRKHHIHNVRELDLELKKDENNKEVDQVLESIGAKVYYELIRELLNLMPEVYFRDYVIYGKRELKYSWSGYKLYSIDFLTSGETYGSYICPLKEFSFEDAIDYIDEHGLRSDKSNILLVWYRGFNRRKYIKDKNLDENAISDNNIDEEIFIDEINNYIATGKINYRYE